MESTEKALEESAGKKSGFAEIFGACLFIGAILIFLALSSFQSQISNGEEPVAAENLVGALGHYTAEVLFLLFGKSAFLLGPYFLLLGILTIARGGFSDPLSRFMAILIMMLGSSVVASMIYAKNSILSQIVGGLVGSRLAGLLQGVFGFYGTAILAVGVLLGGVFIAIRMPISLFFLKLQVYLSAFFERYSYIFTAPQSAYAKQPSAPSYLRKEPVTKQEAAFSSERRISEDDMISQAKNSPSLSQACIPSAQDDRISQAKRSAKQSSANEPYIQKERAIHRPWFERVEKQVATGSKRAQKKKAPPQPFSYSLRASEETRSLQLALEDLEKRFQASPAPPKEPASVLENEEELSRPPHTSSYFQGRFNSDKTRFYFHSIYQAKEQTEQSNGSGKYSRNSWSFTGLQEPSKEDMQAVDLRALEQGNGLSYLSVPRMGGGPSSPASLELGGRGQNQTDHAQAVDRKAAELQSGQESVSSSYMSGQGGAPSSPASLELGGRGQNEADHAQAVDRKAAELRSGQESVSSSYMSGQGGTPSSPASVELGGRGQNQTDHAQAVDRKAAELQSGQESVSSSYMSGQGGGPSSPASLELGGCGQNEAEHAQAVDHKAAELQSGQESVSSSYMSGQGGAPSSPASLELGGRRQNLQADHAQAVDRKAAELRSGQESVSSSYMSGQGGAPSSPASLELRGRGQNEADHQQAGNHKPAELQSGQEPVSSSYMSGMGGAPSSPASLELGGRGQNESDHAQAVDRKAAELQSGQESVSSSYMSGQGGAPSSPASLELGGCGQNEAEHAQAVDRKAAELQSGQESVSSSYMSGQGGGPSSPASLELGGRRQNEAEHAQAVDHKAAELQSGQESVSSSYMSGQGGGPSSPASLELRGRGQNEAEHAQAVDHKAAALQSGQEPVSSSYMSGQGGAPSSPASLELGGRGQNESEHAQAVDHKAAALQSGQEPVSSSYMSGQGGAPSSPASLELRGRGQNEAEHAQAVDHKAAELQSGQESLSSSYMSGQGGAPSSPASLELGGRGQNESEHAQAGDRKAAELQSGQESERGMAGAISDARHRGEDEEGVENESANGINEEAGSGGGAGPLDLAQDEEAAKDALEETQELSQEEIEERADTMSQEKADAPLHDELAHGEEDTQEEDGNWEIVSRSPRAEIQQRRAPKRQNNVYEEVLIRSQVPSLPYSYRDYKLSRDILCEPEPIPHTNIAQELSEVRTGLTKVMREYGIQAEVVATQRGPIITLYELKLEPGIKLARVVNLQNEICMNLAVPIVRIIAPIPGKSTIGIEIPNRVREPVLFSQLLPAPPGNLKIVVGKDISGKNQYAELTQLPHLLIAGATGAGKSVYLNSVIASILYHASPEDVRFVMIDPKMVELKLYEGIPHLLMPVITDVYEASKALRWLLDEMERRYKILSDLRCRDLRSYNERIQQNSIEQEEALETMPYILVLIDELSDLMMVAAKDVEDSIIRLTQKARAVGIHIIMATQRPSVDVITALIKANCPARVAFQVAQRTDSRIILDANGAENLIGRGDLLYKSPQSTALTRLQAPFISEAEIESIVEQSKSFGEAIYVDLQSSPEAGQPKSQEEGINEDLFREALEIVWETGKTSTSYLQRRMRIGYNRSANLIEMMEERGYLGPLSGNKAREILKRA